MKAMWLEVPLTLSSASLWCFTSPQWTPRFLTLAQTAILLSYISPPPRFHSCSSFCLNYFFAILTHFPHLCLINSVQTLVIWGSFLDFLRQISVSPAPEALCPAPPPHPPPTPRSYSANHTAVLIYTSPSLDWNTQLLISISHSPLSTDF